MEKVLFYHGGPGMNGNPERNILTDLYAHNGIQLICWDEPSALRTQGYPFIQENAFANYQRSAEEFLLANYEGHPIPLILYCFATQIAGHIIDKHPEKIAKIIIISPDFCLSASDLNIFKMISDDFAQHGQQNQADAMANIITNYSECYDENTMNGWLLAIENPRMFEYYWQTRPDMEAYVKFYKDSYAIDPLSFLSVRRDWRKPSLNTVAIPTTIIYGVHDRIVSIDKELDVIKDRFANHQVIKMERSGHYPQIEEAEQVLDIIRSTIDPSLAQIN